MYSIAYFVKKCKVFLRSRIGGIGKVSENADSAYKNEASHMA